MCSLIISDSVAVEIFTIGQPCAKIFRKVWCVCSTFFLRHGVDYVDIAGHSSTRGDNQNTVGGIGDFYPYTQKYSHSYYQPSMEYCIPLICCRFLLQDRHMLQWPPGLATACLIRFCFTVFLEIFDLKWSFVCLAVWNVYVCCYLGKAFITAAELPAIFVSFGYFLVFIWADILINQIKLA